MPRFAVYLRTRRRIQIIEYIRALGLASVRVQTLLHPQVGVMVSPYVSSDGPKEPSYVTKPPWNAARSLHR